MLQSREISLCFKSNNLTSEYVTFGFCKVCYICTFSLKNSYEIFFLISVLDHTRGKIKLEVKKNSNFSFTDV